MRAFILPVLLLSAGQLPAQPPEPPKLPLPVREVVAALIETFKDVDPEVRVNSANALAALGESAVKPLMAVLVDPKAEVRAAAAYALGLMGVDAVPSVAGLVKLLKDGDKEVRRQSTQALSRILLAQRQPLVPLNIPGVSPPVPLFPEIRP